MTGDMMTGEMSQGEVTREAYPLYFACADEIEGATVKPFDQYQGPYIYAPGKGRFFLCAELDRCYEWWSEATDCTSDPFLGEWDADNEEAVSAFLDLIENGGTPVKR